ncbi:MAG: NAD-dependent succinate-semialdehyde dehydrogenase [Acidobacteria bacterium]|jgi:succinate-semialdehyde dehydrogenase/glutarate-semialdehyde dehydrogenase|nr:NAD-dependent succinate-semialdehyde dehydrogenase [Acidobacteriota bacterium]
MAMEAINPATGEIIKTYATMNHEEVEQVIDLCHQAFLGWHNIAIGERSVLLKQAAQVLRNNVNEYAELMALEMGKPINEGRAEANKCALVCDYYADNAEKFLKSEYVETDFSQSFISFQPLGVILAVMPWNFPFWQVFRFAAPALMTGNVAVLKHASNVPGCALAIEEIFKKAGFPANIFRTLMIGSRQVDAVIENPRVMAVTLTGSTGAGKSVAAKAGQMLKKTVLELGGSDAYIVLADADLDETAAACAASRLINSGQSCIAAKRFIVVESVKERFIELFTAKMRSYKMGDPLDETVLVGPQARQDLRDDLHRQVQESIARGAICLLGGEIPPGKGAYYPPTILSGVKKGMPAYDEEMFGPVAAIIPVKNEDDAIKTANDSVFGLGAAVFTRDIARGTRLAEKKIQAGSCFVNTFVRSDPRLPFGGIKDSGYGRELSHFGIKEFVNIKTISVK